jgi:hypothetical protein
VLLQIDYSSDPLDWWAWSPNGNVYIENPGTIGELDYDCSMVAVSYAINNTARADNTLNPTLNDRGQDLLTLGSPCLHKNLFEKFEALLNMCKSCTIIFFRVILT